MWAVPIQEIIPNIHPSLADFNYTTNFINFLIYEFNDNDESGLCSVKVFCVNNEISHVEVVVKEEPTRSNVGPYQRVIVPLAVWPSYRKK